MNKSSFYVEPYFSVRNYFEKDELSTRELKDIKVEKISDVIQLENRLGVVIAKPGNGKSRFLKELLLEAKEDRKESIFIDLKEIDASPSTPLEKSIRDLLPRCEIIDEEKIDEEIIRQKRLLSTSNFQFNNESNNIIICLDALDEINPKLHFEIIKKVRAFRANFPNIILFLSCRKYICKKHISELDDLSPNYIEIYPFTYIRVSKYLKSSGFTDEQINETTLKFGARLNNESVIGSPRILEIFVSIALKEGLQVALEMNKSELIETFIYKKLDREDRVIRANHVAAVKRVLEKLALVMEIYHKKEITKDELMTFFDDINSNLVNGLFQQGDLNYFYQRSLLIDFGETVQFENAEFQEYLAAKEISRLGDVEQKSFELIFNQPLLEFDTYWFSTLNYLVDFSSQLQLKIIDFISKRESPLDLNVVPHILSNSPQRLEELTSQKHFIFSTMLNHFHLTERYMHGDSAKRLAFYFTAESEQILKENVSSDNLISQGNSVYVLGYILKSEILVDTVFWKNKLITFLNTENENLFNLVVSALAEFKEIKLFKDNFDFKTLVDEKKSNSMWTYINAIQSIDSNHFYLIDMLIEDLKLDLSSFTSDFILEIKSKEGIKYLLKKLNEDVMCQQQFSHYISSKSFYKTLIRNIESVYDDEINKLCEQVKPSDFQTDDFFIEILKLQCRKNSNYFSNLHKFEYFKQYPFNSVVHKKFFDFLDDENIESVVKEFRKHEAGINLLLLSIRYAKNDESLCNNELVLKAENLLNQEIETWYKKLEENQKTHLKNSQKVELKRYQKFQEKLMLNDSNFGLDLFDYFKRFKNSVLEFSTKEEFEDLRKKALGAIHKIDFSKSQITETKKDDRTTTVSYPRHERVFKSVLAVIEDLQIEITTKIRSKIIEFLPFSLYNSSSEQIFKLIPELNDDEINYLKEFYLQNREDDLFDVNSKNLFDTVKKYKLHGFVPIVASIAIDFDFNSQNRWDALSTLEELLGDKSKEYFIDFFESYKNKTEWNEKSLAFHLNQFRLKKPTTFQDAFDWQMQSFFSHIKDYNPKNPHQGDVYHHFNSRMVNPLREIRNPELLDSYIKLFNESIELGKKGEDFYPAAKNIWDCIFGYLENLRFGKSKTPLDKLERAILKNSDYKQMDIVKRMFVDLKYKYLQEIGKPETINSCVQKYNSLKQRQYLSITGAEDLIELIKEIIEKDIANWVEKEGAYKMIFEAGRKQEDLIQKTIFTQFRYFLSERGIRKHETYIRREEQLLDDKRTDFVISYGFIGQVLIEIKLTKNQQIFDKTQSEKYREKLQKYIKGTNSDNGIFLIFQVDKEHKWSDHKSRIEKIYEDDFDIHVLGYNCIEKV
jgi:hypothetical protein